MNVRAFRAAGQPVPEKPPRFPPRRTGNRPPVRRKPTLLVRAEVSKS
jgi:hypothetical protein